MVATLFDPINNLCWHGRTQLGGAGSAGLLQAAVAEVALTNNLLQKFSQTAEKISRTEENYKSFQLQSHKETFNGKHWKLIQ